MIVTLNKYENIDVMLLFRWHVWVVPLRELGFPHFHPIHYNHILSNNNQSFMKSNDNC